MVARRFLGVVVTGALFLPSPALASRGKVVSEEQRLDAYARARMAEADRALLTAASAYRHALAIDPSSAEVAARGYRQAVLAGDKMLALSAARSLDRAGMLPRDGTVLLLIDALDHAKWADAFSLIDRLEREENLAFVVPFMRSWVSMRSGPYDPPAIPVDKPYAGFAVRYLEEQLLLQRLARGDGAGAVDAYLKAKQRRTAFGPQQRAILAAQFAALGRSDIGIELLRGDAGEGGVERALEQASGQYKNSRLGPQQGLAHLMYRLALDLLDQSEGTAPLSIVRIASFADPANDDVKLAVARAALMADYPTAAALEAAKISRLSAAWFDAVSLRLRALVEQDQGDAAVLQAKQLAKSHDEARFWRLLGDMLVLTDNFAGSAEAYAKARARMADKNDPALLLQLGASLERIGHWAEAKPLLEMVVALSPDSAVALNHLGYALADRGEELPKAIALLEKANRIRPENAAFIDSLGWALFRAGKYDKALPLIQDAAAAEPGNSELNEHLGDVLWAMGRRFEARYAWKAALAGLEDDGEGARLRTRVLQKLAEAGVVAGTP